mmetsp:Transcript_97205/g.299655  ORF Transcript_97205/g.299655 Transcript_97205/m.299655 type:complete len:273 (+) Transcript_97205:1170-1988(+)
MAEAIIAEQGLVERGHGQEVSEPHDILVAIEGIRLVGPVHPCVAPCLVIKHLLQQPVKDPAGLHCIGRHLLEGCHRGVEAEGQMIPARGEGQLLGLITHAPDGIHLAKVQAVGSLCDPLHQRSLLCGPAPWRPRGLGVSSPGDSPAPPLGRGRRAHLTTTGLQGKGRQGQTGASSSSQAPPGAEAPEPSDASTEEHRQRRLQGHRGKCGPQENLQEPARLSKAVTPGPINGPWIVQEGQHQYPANSPGLANVCESTSRGLHRKFGVRDPAQS